MTGLYVASNVQSLVSQVQLQRNMSALGDILTRLSTGLRINSGKDDPAGLIADELLKSDITATGMAIRNTQRANSMISVADSAMGQVSNLLNDIRGLVNEAANTGAMSAEQIAANQLQLDASLDSIDRISKTTNFQGQLLLDGSLDFDTQGVDRSAITDLNIFQANFGTQKSIGVNVDIKKDASRAQLFYDKGGVSTQTILEVMGNKGNDVFKFEAGTTVGQMAEAINMVSDSTGVQAVVGNDATYGQIMMTSAGANNDINLTSVIPGAAGGNYTVKYTAGDSDEISYTITEPSGGNPGIINFKLKMDEVAYPSNEHLDESFNGLYTYDITGDPDGGGIVVESSNGQQIRKVEYVAYTGSNATALAGGVAAVFNQGTGILQIQYNGDATDEGLAAAINTIDGLRLVSGDTGSLPTESQFAVPMDLRSNNALDISATVAGSQFENTDVVYVYDPTVEDLADNKKVGDVALAYLDNPQSAAATIKWGDGTGTDADADPPEYDIQMRLVGKQTGAAMNDVTIRFEQNNAMDPGKVTAVYDAKNKILHVQGQIDNTDETLNATYGAMKAAIEECSPLRVDVTILDGDPSTDPATIGPLNGKPLPLSNKIKTGLVTDAEDLGLTANEAENSYIKTGQVYGDIGTDHKALFVRVGSTDVTANDVIAAFTDTENAPFAKIAANFTVTNSLGSTGTGVIFDETFDNPDGADATKPVVTVRNFSGALSGGNDGLTTNTTAKELVAFINNDETLNKLFQADLGYGQSGDGFLTLFDEAAYYGSPWEETGLQFLGPKDSPDIIFVTDGANSDLGISFTSGSAGSDCLVGDGRPVASLLAQNVNAAFTVTALNTGEEYDNMAVRLIRLDNNHKVEYSDPDDPTSAVVRDDSYVQYTKGPSNAMAYCSIDDVDSGTPEERGKFIVYGVQGGTQLNNVSIVAKLDENQSEPVLAYYDESNKKLTLTVQSGDTTLEDAVAAINATGIFRAEYDFSHNQEPANTGPGIDTFENFFTARSEGEIGNTGNTGGYNGVLEVYVAGDDSQATSQRAVDAINKDPILSTLFAGNVLHQGDESNPGILDFRKDNFRTSIDSCGAKVTEVNMVTGTNRTNTNGYMVVHLATDQFGNSITSARDLVKFMDTLTPEQTRGISVSLVRPEGVDNLNRTWSVDQCGNVTVTQGCEDDFGKGILQPTVEVDECDNVIYHPIEFWSYGEYLVDSKSYGSVVAVNGINASLQITAKEAGPQYDGVTFKYVSLVDATAPMYAEYDPSAKQIAVYIHDGATAATVKQLIEQSETTKDLFSVILEGDGSGVVTTADDYLITKNGLVDAGYRGGAKILGAADADEHRLVFESTDEGSSQKVVVHALEGDFQLKDVNGKYADTAYGTDMEASMNGISMKAEGRTISLDSSMLKLSMTVDEKVTTGDSLQFTITGGGATFQLGPDVVSNQQIRVGIQTINTARLGGPSGRLYQLRSGNIADLSTDTKLADKIVQEAIVSVAMFRGRLGALQRCTLDSNIISLQDSLEQLDAAEAQISNADFAEESSRLTRAQILVQSGAKTLAIANQIPQYAASLIG